MLNGGSTGASVAHGFIFSVEMERRNLSNSDFVEILYNAFMGRASDAGGKTHWVGELNRGVPRVNVFAGFANSHEFNVICNSYGIQRGAFTAPSLPNILVPRPDAPSTQTLPVQNPQNPPRQTPPPTNQTSQNPPPNTPPPQTPPPQNPPRQQQYGYTLHVLTPQSQYNLMNVYFYVETNNPSPRGLIYKITRVSDGKEEIRFSMSELAFRDVQYTGNDYGPFQSVPGGYMFRQSFSQPGDYIITVYEVDPTLPNNTTQEFFAREASALKIDNTATRVAISGGGSEFSDTKHIIDNATNDSMTLLQKLRAAERFISENYKYPLNTSGFENPPLLILLLATYNPHPGKNPIADSLAAPSLLADVARALGVPNGNIAQGSHHSLVRITIDGVEHNFNPTPHGGTNSIDPINIQYYRFPNQPPPPPPKITIPPTGTVTLNPGGNGGTCSEHGSFSSGNGCPVCWQINAGWLRHCAIHGLFDASKGCQQCNAITPPATVTLTVDRPPGASDAEYERVISLAVFDAMQEQGWSAARTTNVPRESDLAGLNTVTFEISQRI